MVGLFIEFKIYMNCKYEKFFKFGDKFLNFIICDVIL